MADVTEIEDLLAALDEDSSKVLHHGGLPVQHMELSHLQQPGTQYGHVQTNRANVLGQNQGQQNQLVSGNLSGGSQLSGQALQNAYPNQRPAMEEAVSVPFQGGSSLGSLFLSSVDELLSSEKTSPLEFAPPTTTAPQPKAVRPKQKKPIQRKPEKTRQFAALDMQNSQLPAQQLQAKGQAMAYKQVPVTHQQFVAAGPTNFNTPNRPPTSSISTDPHYMAAPSPETFSRNAYRQSSSQRPQSNTSCDSSVYNINSIPQPSPSGSVDSNFNPRTPHSNNPLTPHSNNPMTPHSNNPLTPHSNNPLTPHSNNPQTPLSNNPLTPQSLQQPLTPQSNQSVPLQGHVSGHVSTVHQQQPQQNQMLQDPSALGVGLGFNIGNSPPPPIPDDQSHLQYLNTTSSLSQQDLSSVAMNLLDDLPTPIKNQFGGLEGLTDHHNVQPATAPLSTNQLQQPGSWYSQFSNSSQYQGVTAQTTSIVNSSVSSITSGVMQAFPQSQGNLQPQYAYQQNMYLQSNAQSEGLTQTQSQLLENFSEWGKTKGKPLTTSTSAQISNLSMLDFDSSIVHGGPEMFGSTNQSYAVNNISSNNSKSNNVLDMLSTAQSGIKQQLADTYEAISPVSDYTNSPANKEALVDQRPQKTSIQTSTLTGERRDFQYTTAQEYGHQQQAQQASRELEKPKVGPLARRRSASVERKTTTSTASTVKAAQRKEKDTSQDFNFDEFGFDDEPTIKLPSQRSGGPPLSPPKKAPVGPKPPAVNPVMKLHREDYSDQSVYDSVQELAALLKKQKSLKDALDASRNQKTSPQKPTWGRVAQPHVVTAPATGQVSAQVKTTKQAAKSSAKTAQFGPTATPDDSAVVKPPVSRTPSSHKSKAVAPKSFNDTLPTAADPTVHIQSYQPAAVTQQQSYGMTSVSQHQSFQPPSTTQFQTHLSDSVTNPHTYLRTPVTQQQSFMPTSTINLQPYPAPPDLSQNTTLPKPHLVAKPSTTLQSLVYQHDPFSTVPAAATTFQPSFESHGLHNPAPTMVSKAVLSKPSVSVPNISVSVQNPAPQSQHNTKSNLPLESSGQALFSGLISCASSTSQTVSSQPKDWNANSMPVFDSQYSAKGNVHSYYNQPQHQIHATVTTTNLRTQPTTHLSQSTNSASAVKNLSTNSDEFASYIGSGNSAHRKTELLKQTAEMTTSKYVAPKGRTTFPDATSALFQTSARGNGQTQQQKQPKQPKQLKVSEEPMQGASQELLSNFEMFLNQAVSDASKKSISKARNSKPKETTAPALPVVTKTTSQPSKIQHHFPTTIAVVSTTQVGKNTYASPVFTAANVDSFFAQSKYPSTGAVPKDPKTTNAPSVAVSYKHDTTSVFRDEVSASELSSFKVKATRRRSKEKSRERVQPTQTVVSDGYRDQAFTTPYTNHNPRMVPAAITQPSMISTVGKFNAPSFAPVNTEPSARKTPTPVLHQPKPSPLPHTAERSRTSLPPAYTEPTVSKALTPANKVSSTASHTIEYTAPPTAAKTVPQSGALPSFESITSQFTMPLPPEKNVEVPPFLPTLGGHHLSGSQLSDVMGRFPGHLMDSGRPKSQEQRALEAFASLSSQPFPTGIFPGVPPHMIGDPAAVNQSYELLRMTRDRMGSVGALNSHSPNDLLLNNLAGGFLGGLPPPYQQPPPPPPPPPVVSAKTPTSVHHSMPSETMSYSQGHPEANPPSWFTNKSNFTQHHLSKHPPPTSGSFSNVETSQTSSIRDVLKTSQSSDSMSANPKPPIKTSEKDNDFNLKPNEPKSINVPVASNASKAVTVTANTTVTPSLPPQMVSPVLSGANDSKPQQIDASGGQSILKDKTYHGPKKKHILEKYSFQQHQKHGPTLPTPTPTPTPTPKRTSLSNSAVPAQAPPVNIPVPLDFSSSATKASPVKAAVTSKTGLKASSLGIASLPVSTAKTKPATTPKPKEVLKTKKATKSADKDEQQSSGIFSVFDSLLQEALETAEPKTPAKSTTLPSTQPTIDKPVDIAPSSEALIAVSPTTRGSAPKPSTISSKNTAAIVSRSPATFPFKRRVQSRPEASNAKPPVASGLESKSTTKSCEVFHHKVSAPTIVPPVLTTTATSAVTTITTSLPGSIATPVSAASPAPTPLGLKLRITAFRSAAGQVIHHSSIVGGLAPDDAVDSDRSTAKKKKHRKQKKRKRKRRSTTSESEDDSQGHSAASVPSVTVKAPPKPVADAPLPVAKPPVAARSSDEHDTDYVPLVPRRDTSNESDVCGSASSAGTSKRKKKLSKSLHPAAKRIRTSSASVDSDVEPVRKRGRPPAKNRAPTMRYKPKTAHSQVTVGESSTTSASMSFNRAPGKPPRYLNASSTLSGSHSGAKSVPTIQLVPRTVAKTTSSCSTLNLVSANQSAAKVLSVKLSVAQTAKPVAPQFVSKSTIGGGLRYILQTTSPGNSAVSVTPRVIIPKVGSPPFSVGKATVFTVSSSGTRVSLPAGISVPLSVSQPTGAIVSPTRPIVVKRLPISLLPKSTISSSTVVVASATVPSSPKTTWASGGVPAQGPLPNGKLATVGPMKPACLSVTSTVVSSKAKASFPIVSAPIIAEALSKSNKTNQNLGESLFQTAFSKVISSPNPLPKYAPPPLPQHLLPTGPLGDTHRCFECGDTFLLHSSLLNHYERRSIFVKVRCVQCNQMLVFFNKCEILRHAREHSDRGDVMQFNGANLTPIPLSLCKPRTRDFFLRAADERRKAAEEDKAPGSVVCTECQFTGDEQSALDEHFQRHTADGRSCDICRLHLHNNCSFAAHMRMHRHVAPHTCPECGQAFDGTAMDFNLHLRMQCFHLSRVSCFKCKLCNVTFTGDDQLRNHLRLNHVQLFYKCRECPMAFKTTQNIANHQRTAHNLTPEPTNTLKTIYKCPLCDTVFTDSSHSQQLFVLHKHFDTHINTTRITAYQCYLCSQLFEQKSLLRDHLLKEHDVSSQDGATALQQQCQEEGTSPIGSTKSGEKRRLADGKKLKAAKRSKADVHKIGIEQKLTSAATKAFTSGSRVNGTPHGAIDVDNPEQSPPSGSMKKHGTPLKIKFKAKASFARQTVVDNPAEGDSIITDDGKRKYPCTECDKLFLSSHSRSSHVRSIHRGIRANYCCPHCATGSVKFAKRISLVKHLLRMHDIVAPKKEDIKIVKIHAPKDPSSEKDASAPSPRKKDVAIHQTPKSSGGYSRSAFVYLPPGASGASEERRSPRKKITTRNPIQARARRLAQQAAMRHQAVKGVSSIESDESYGEVDEKMVEESWNVPDEMDAEVSDTDAEIDIGALRLPSVYTCVKCDFQHEDRLAFQEHIVEHSSQSIESAVSGATAALTMVQCTECGLCFASTASLDKHLHVRHKIRQRKLLERHDSRLRAARVASGHVPTAYSSKLDQSDSNPGASTLPKLHRCKVCFHRFDSDTELRTHMRTHGLAFVKSKTS